jgi:hypothetical protein
MLGGCGRKVQVAWWIVATVPREVEGFWNNMWAEEPEAGKVVRWHGSILTQAAPSRPHTVPESSLVFACIEFLPMTIVAVIKTR